MSLATELTHLIDTYVMERGMPAAVIVHAAPATTPSMPLDRVLRVSMWGMMTSDVTWQTKPAGWDALGPREEFLVVWDGDKGYALPVVKTSYTPLHPALSANAVRDFHADLLSVAKDADYYDDEY